MFIEPRHIFDVAFIGWGRRPADTEITTCYDWFRLTEAASHWLSCTFEEAAEYVAFNIDGAWVGPATPLIVNRGTPAQLEELL